MKVTGGATLNAPIEAVWTALNDPAVLVRTIPGCERLEATGTDSYRLTITTGMAAVRGTYTGEVSLADQLPPGSFTLKASGTGGPGTISTDVRVQLAATPEGSTWLSYEADAVVGGVIAGVGQRMLAGVAKRMAEQFFGSVDELLTGAAGPAGAAEIATLAGAGLAGAAPAGTGLAGTGPAGAGSAGSGLAGTGLAGAGLGGAGLSGAGLAGAGQAEPGVFVAPPRAGARASDGPGFAVGVLAGGVIALGGVLIGGLLGRRNS